MAGSETERSGVAGLDELQRRIAYRFRDPGRLQLALTHRSGVAVGEGAAPTSGAARDDNERLEFLGDAVLGLRSSERLFAAFPQSSEGGLSRLRSWLVSARHLATVADAMQLAQHVDLSHSKAGVGGRGRQRILADALEAIIGAIHLDGGYAAAAAFVDAHVLGVEFEQLSPDSLHAFVYKSVLQEWAHVEGHPLPVYRVVETAGPEHGKTYTVEVSVAGISTVASGPSRKEAEQLAAQGALLQLGAINP